MSSRPSEPEFKRPELPLPNRGPSTTASLFPPATGPSSSLRATSQVAAGGKRAGKVQLAPGHSPLDWARLTASSKNLRGPPSSSSTGLAEDWRTRRITTGELKGHSRRGDVWMAVSGRVYNCTPYLDYHPGGPGQLLRGAGRDATRMFMEVHAWVNAESMLDKCCVGILVPDPVSATASEEST